MAIRYNSELNNEMRRIVRNYNKRRYRMLKAGFKSIPPAAKVSELRRRYTVRTDLVKELNRLQNLRRGDILKKVETSGGIKAVSWEYSYLKDNARAAKDYFQREYERISKRVGKFPGERTYLDTVRAKIDLLDMNIKYMTQSQFRSAVTAVNEFAAAPTMRRQQYRGFLSEVDWVMEKLGYTERQRNKFFNKFSKLTPSQFVYAFDNNDIIARIYNLYHKDYGDNEAWLTTSDEDARDLVDELMEQADEIVKDAQLNMD